MDDSQKLLTFTLNKKFKASIEESEGGEFLVGREQPANRLMSILVNRKASTTLVSGLRGVGKTSFVRAVLQNVVKQNAKTIPVYLSFAEIELKDDETSQSLRGVVLKTLVRSLYIKLSTQGDFKVPKELSDLYEQTNYSSISQESKVGLLKSRSQKDVSEKSQKFTHVYQLSSDLKALIVLFLLIPIYNYIFSLGIADWLKYAFFLVSVGPILWVILLKKTTTESSTVISSEDTDLNQETGNFSTNKILDNTFETLELKFHNVLEILSKDGHRIVFILDELDKLQDKTTALQSSKIIELVKPLKNLFTLSDANFVFISDESFYDKLTEHNSTVPYSSSYTIFTDKIFLPTHSTNDVKKITNSLVENIAAGKDKVEQFISYLCFISKNHIFTLYENLENFVRYDDAGLPIVGVTTEYHQRGNLKDEWEIEAACCVYIDATSSFYFKPNDPRYNQRLYELLHRTCLELVAPNYKIKALQTDWLSSITLDDSEDEEFVSDASGAVEFMLKSMERDGFCKASKEQKTIDGKNVFEYTFEVNKLIYPSKTSLIDLNQKLSFEEKYIESFKRIEADLKDVKDSAFFEVVESMKNEIEQLRRTYRRVTTKGKYKMSKSDVEDSQADLELLEARLSEAVDKEIVTGLCSDLGLSKSPLGRAPNGHPWTVFDGKLSSFYKALEPYHDANNAAILTNPSHTRSLVILWGADEKLSRVFESIEQADRKDARSRVVSINPSDKLKTVSYWSNIDGLDYKSLDADYKRVKNRCEEYLKDGES